MSFSDPEPRLNNGHINIIGSLTCLFGFPDSKGSTVLLQDSKYGKEASKLVMNTKVKFLFLKSGIIS